MSAAEFPQADPANGSAADDPEPAETRLPVRRVLSATEWADFGEWLRSMA